MEQKDAMPVNDPAKQKPGPKPKEKTVGITQEEAAQPEHTHENISMEKEELNSLPDQLIKAGKKTQKEKDQTEAVHEEEMVEVDFPIRASNGTILNYIKKKVSLALAEQEIAKWQNGGLGHSAWRDVKFSK